jgi:hypothetical protein
MKMKKSLIWSLVLLIVVAAVYRVIPDRPLGFAPHWAMALFGGSMIKDKRYAFALPVFSMFLSDLIYQVLYINGLSNLPGFYNGQVTNYILFAAITAIGFLMKRVTVINILGYSLIVATAYFVASNFLIWINGGGLVRPKTWSGLLQCYADGLPFYRGSIIATLVFSTFLFGVYFLFYKQKPEAKPRIA